LPRRKVSPADSRTVTQSVALPQFGGYGTLHGLARSRPPCVLTARAQAGSRTWIARAAVKSFTRLA
jgi:hypothetical protein